MTKMQKMILVAAALAGFSATVSAQTKPCQAGTVATTVGITPATTTALFIQVPFNLNCSANVYLTYDETATSADAASASKKGNQAYYGNTGGGSVTGTGTTVSNGFASCNTSTACEAN